MFENTIVIIIKFHIDFIGFLFVCLYGLEKNAQVFLIFMAEKKTIEK